MLNCCPVKITIHVFVVVLAEDSLSVAMYSICGINLKFTVNNDLSILPPSSPMGSALEETYQQYQNR